MPTNWEILEMVLLHKSQPSTGSQIICIKIKIKSPILYWNQDKFGIPLLEIGYPDSTSHFISVVFNGPL